MSTELTKVMTKKESIVKQLQGAQASLLTKQVITKKRMEAKWTIVVAYTIEAFKNGQEFTEEYANGFKDCYAS